MFKLPFMPIIFKKVKTILLLLFICCNACKPKPPINVSDGFETNELSDIWSKDRMESKALTFQSTIVRNGHSAAQITLHTGDTFEKGEGKSKDSERDELREADDLFSVEGKTYEQHFSLFLPADFPIVPTRLVIAQWKQYCNGNGLCSDDSPVMAIRYVSGKLYVTLQESDGERTTVYQTKEEIRNRWLNFKFKFRFSRTNNGLVEASLNDSTIIQYKGVTAYTSAKGYKDKSYFYFKMGLYRDVMPKPMTIYIDDYSKKEVVE